MEGRKYAIHVTTILEDLEQIAEYMNKNAWKLDKVTNRKGPGLRGDWYVYHYEPGSGKSLYDLRLTDEELAQLERLLTVKG